MADSPIFYCKNCGRPVKNPAEGCPCIEQGIGFRPPEEEKDEKKRRKRKKGKLFCFHRFAWEAVSRNQCARKCVKCATVKPGTAVPHDFAPEGGIPVCRRCGYRGPAGRGAEPVKESPIQDGQPWRVAD